MEKTTIWILALVFDSEEWMMNFNVLIIKIFVFGLQVVSQDGNSSATERSPQTADRAPDSRQWPERGRRPPHNRHVTFLLNALRPPLLSNLTHCTSMTLFSPYVSCHRVSLCILYLSCSQFYVWSFSVVRFCCFSSFYFPRPHVHAAFSCFLFHSSLLFLSYHVCSCVTRRSFRGVGLYPSSSSSSSSAGGGLSDPAELHGLLGVGQCVPSAYQTA